MSSKALSLTEGRKKIFELAEEVQTPGSYVLFTQNGAPKAVLLSVNEFESLLETIDVLQESPDLLSRIAEIDKDMETDKMENYSTLDTLLSKKILLVSEPKKSYGISNSLRGKKSKIPENLKK